jgi:hypothetical protein
MEMKESDVSRGAAIAILVLAAVALFLKNMTGFYALLIVSNQYRIMYMQHKDQEHKRALYTAVVECTAAMTTAELKRSMDLGGDDNNDPEREG